MKVVLAVGLVLFAIGGTLLFFTLRAFGRAKRGDIQHIVLLVTTIIFVLISCAGLFVWSMIFTR